MPDLPAGHLRSDRVPESVRRGNKPAEYSDSLVLSSRMDAGRVWLSPLRHGSCSAARLEMKAVIPGTNRKDKEDESMKTRELMLSVIVTIAAPAGVGSYDMNHEER